MDATALYGENAAGPNQAKTIRATLTTHVTLKELLLLFSIAGILVFFVPNRTEIQAPHLNEYYRHTAGDAVVFVEAVGIGNELWSTYSEAFGTIQPAGSDTVRILRFSDQDANARCVLFRVVPVTKNEGTVLEYVVQPVKSFAEEYVPASSMQTARPASADHPSTTTRVRNAE